MHQLRFRQVHLDFHTSEKIPGIGAAFDKKTYQDMLKRGHIDSITTFAKCHHGWSYHPTQVGRMHPELSYDLLRAQFDACKEIDVNVPIYLSAGLDNAIAAEHPEWREISPDGKFAGWTASPLDAGFIMMCFNSPYLEYLCDQIREVCTLFPNHDGIFLDIICQSPCCCPYCMAVMRKEGLDPTKPEDRQACARMALDRYYRMTTAACRENNPEAPVFHNSGHIARGYRQILPYFSHLELESLPTGGWGYDHFPLSAKYADLLGMSFLGMTGKFHTSWGEFGGFKHPNALRYECAAMIAFGAKCSIGDQLHPNAALDETTYDIIGAAYAEVEAKEAWCRNTKNVASVAILSEQAMLSNGHGGNESGDIGATRILLESHILFDVIDAEMDFTAYKVLILPDRIPVNAMLKTKIDAFLAQGGKLILSGISGLTEDKSGFLFDIGATYSGESACQPDYALPAEAYRPDFLKTPVVMYLRSQRITPTTAESLGDIHDPYFNRTYAHFCSHAHAPNKPEASGFALGTRTDNILYFAHPVFSLYYAWGAVPYRQFITKAIRSFIGADAGLSTNMPSTARVSLRHQTEAKRHVLHLLSATTVNRGGSSDKVSDVFKKDGIRGIHGIEVIEELNPVFNAQATITTPINVSRVTLEPQGQEIPFEKKDGAVTITVPEFTCHQMVALHE